MNAIVEVESAVSTTVAAKSIVVLAMKVMTYVRKIVASTSAVAHTPNFLGTSVIANGPNSLNFEGGLISAA